MSGPSWSENGRSVCRCPRALFHSHSEWTKEWGQVKGWLDLQPRMRLAMQRCPFLCHSCRPQLSVVYGRTEDHTVFQKELRAAFVEAQHTSHHQDVAIQRGERVLFQ